MNIPELSEEGLKMAALSSAMVSVLASVYCENALLREILKEKGLLSDEEWVNQLKEFSASKWKQYQSQIQETIQRKSGDFLKKQGGAQPQ